MASSPRGRTTRLTEGIRNQHVAMSVAAGLARAQLVPNALGVYDSHHLSEMLERIAGEIARVAPVYAVDPTSGEACRLAEAELDGARFERGATALALKDGRTLTSVWVTRGDLRDAVVVLKAIGFQGEQPAGSAAPALDLEAHVREILRLLGLPAAPGQLEQVSRLAMDIARAARDGGVVNQAVQLMSALHALRIRAQPRPPGGLDAALVALQQAIVGRVR